MVVFFGGSRSLPPAGVAAARAVSLLLLSSPYRVSVGDARGADAALVWSFVQAGQASRLSVFSATPQRPAFVQAAARAGAVVVPAPALPVRAALAVRTRSATAAASQFGVVVVGSPASKGSLAAAAQVVAAGLHVLVVCAGFSPAALAPFGFGQWSPAGCLAGCPVVCWSPAPPLL